MSKKPMTVHEVVNLTGITTRTLHYYDEIGLLKPSIVTDAKYRLYTDDDLCRLQEILFFREVGFALKEIKSLLHSPCYSRTEALEKHLSILEAQKERIDGLIALVEADLNGTKEISFSAFSNSKVLELQTKYREEPYIIHQKNRKSKLHLGYKCGFSFTNLAFRIQKQHFVYKYLVVVYKNCVSIYKLASLLTIEFLDATLPLII